MKHVKELLEAVTDKLKGLARGNSVVAKPISVGERHVVPLCELSFGFGAGGGMGEGAEAGKGGGKGVGGGAGAGVKATPVAVVVVDGGKVRVESLGQ